MVDPRRSLAQPDHVGHRVGDEHDRLAAIAEVGDLVAALGLEFGVADREHLVDDQHIGVDVDGDGEAEPDEHPGGVVLDRRVDELLEAGELDDVVEALVRRASAGTPRMAAFRKTFSRPLSSGWKPAPSSSNAEIEPFDRDLALVGLEDLREALQQRRLAAAVVTDDAERLALARRRS